MRGKTLPKAGIKWDQQVLNTLRITPIGTCRIHSPLKRAVLRYPVELDLSRNYGFVHTSSEALQQIRFLSGEKSFAPEALPLVFRSPAEAESLKAERWEPSDLTIVEISSGKSIRLRDDFVQINYLYKAFPEFFANTARARAYWSLARHSDRGGLLQFLKEQQALIRLPDETFDLLLNLRLEEQAFKAIMADMEAIADRLGKDRLLFVTHVNALGPDDNVVASRDRLIRWVKLAGERLGVPVYDPTLAMQEFGQERALERGGLDLTHYTPIFFDRIYDDLHQSFIGAQMRAKVGDAAMEQQDGRVAGLAANLEVMLELGDFFSTAREVHRALDETPDADPLIGLRGLIRSRVGDYPNAAKDFSRIENEAILSQSMRVAKLQALNALGDHAGALAIAESLFADEFASAELYAGASAAAEQLGDPAGAISYAKQAFRMDQSDLPIALRALKLMIAEGRNEEAADWRREVRENSSGTSSGAFEVCAWAVQHRDLDLFTASLRSVAKFDKGGTIDLLEDAFAAGMFKAVADSVPAAVAMGRLSRSLAERRATLLNRLLEQGPALLERGEMEVAWSVARALRGLKEVDNPQIPVKQLFSSGHRLGQAVTKDVRDAVREARARNDPELMESLAAQWSDVIIAEPDAALNIARSLHEKGQHEAALAIIMQALQLHPDNYSLIRWAARIGVQARDYAVATRSYARLRRDFAPRAKSLLPEIKRFFSIVEARGIKRNREFLALGHYGEAAELIGALSAELPPSERLERETNLIHKALRIRLKEIDLGEADIAGRERLLRQLVEVKPNDEAMLRRLAVELMRQFRFGDAAEIWTRLLTLNPENEAAERSLERCQTLAARGRPVGEVQFEVEA